MIVFCEDCSSRNDLTSPRFEKNKILFRCKACGYLNRISPPPGSRLSPFNRLTAEPDVIGAFSYHTRKGIRHNSMPEMLREKDLLTLGQRLVGSYKLALAQFSDISRMTLAIDKKNLVYHPFEPDYGLIIVCRSLPVSSRIESLLEGLGMGGLELDGMDIFSNGQTS